MDHHTYAKCGSKKWSVEEKRLLVTKRIEADDLFSKCSSKDSEPWKKFQSMANIGDYSDRALRKQWLNMVQRYRIQKSTMQMSPLNQQSINVLNEEWEHFGEIHAYMNQKTTDLHSYALKEPNLLPEQQLAIRGVVNDHSFCASTGLGPYIVVKKEYDPELVIKQEMDSQDAPGERQQQVLQADELSTDVFSDSESEESSQPSDPVAAEVSDLSEPDEGEDAKMASPLPAKYAGTVDQMMPTSAETANSVSLSVVEPIASESTAQAQAQAQPKLIKQPAKRKRKALSERDKYYRHRRRYEHRMELRVGNICKIAGQILEHLVPTLNVTPLLMNLNNNVEFNCTSSCDGNDEGTDDDDDDDADADDAAAAADDDDNNNHNDGQQQ